MDLAYLEAFFLRMTLHHELSDLYLQIETGTAEPFSKKCAILEVNLGQIFVDFFGNFPRVCSSDFLLVRAYIRI